MLIISEYKFGENSRAIIPVISDILMWMSCSEVKKVSRIISIACHGKN